MRYVILIYGNPASREIWEGMPDTERAAGYQAYAALDEELVASGELILSEALADPSRGRRVTAGEGRPVATDGPFAEVKEHLAGFYVVECESADRAIEIAAKVPEASLRPPIAPPHGLVEVRPIMDLGGVEM